MRLDLEKNITISVDQTLLSGFIPNCRYRLRKSSLGLSKHCCYSSYAIFTIYSSRLPLFVGAERRRHVVGASGLLLGAGAEGPHLHIRGIYLHQKIVLGYDVPKGTRRH